LSFDVRDDVGWLVRDSGLAQRLELHIGDARTLLPREIAGLAIDMFVHDSDHDYDHQRFEFETVYPHCAVGSILISDDAVGGTAFADFCRQVGIPWWVAVEKPRRHVYPGAGIGLALAASH
jgi:hypothetical protein